MAVRSTLTKSTLTFKYVDGVDVNGKDITKTKKLSNIKVTAADQNIFDVEQAFSNLMKSPIIEAYRSDDNLLTNA